MTITKQTYILSDPAGGWWLHLPRVYNQTYRVDGEEVGDQWQHFDHRPTSIETVKPGGVDIIGYRLAADIPPTAMLRSPITVAEWREMGDEDADGYAPRFVGLYEQITEPRPEVVEPFDIPTIELVGRVATIPDGLTYKATLPVELREHREYVHLFPGTLSGCVEALKTLTKSLGAEVHDYSGKWEINKILTIPNETIMVKPFGGGRKIRRANTLGVKVDLPRVTQITGESLADALTKWEAVVAQYTKTLTALRGVTACPTCRTAGVVPIQGEH